MNKTHKKSFYSSVKLIVFVLYSLLWINVSIVLASAQPQMQPAKVAVDKITVQTIEPKLEFIGTVYYQKVSDVASEIEGIVEEVNFDEGQRVRKGHVLVRLNSDLLKKELQSTIASYEEALAEVENAKLDLARIEGLYKKNFAPAQEYDAQRYRLEGLRKKAQSLEAQVERIRVELEKKTVFAPFDGIVINKSVEPGEWLSSGSTVATIAKDDMLDIIAEVPERVLSGIKPGLKVKVQILGKQLEGKVLTIIPRGDSNTRTFPVKIRVANKSSFIEGMEALIYLPEGKKFDGFVAPRDAVINMFGSAVIFTVVEGKAKMVQVNVKGYSGMEAAIEAQGLEPGMDVVVKGHERLKDGQPVKY